MKKLITKYRSYLTPARQLIGVFSTGIIFLILFCLGLITVK